MEFDKALDEYTETLRTGRKMQLEILLKEIDEHNYTTFNQLLGALHTHLDLINNKEGSNE